MFMVVACRHFRVVCWCLWCGFLSRRTSGRAYCVFQLPFGTFSPSPLARQSPLCPMLRILSCYGSTPTPMAVAPAALCPLSGWGQRLVCMGATFAGCAFRLKREACHCSILFPCRIPCGDVRMRVSVCLSVCIRRSRSG